MPARPTASPDLDDPRPEAGGPSVRPPGQLDLEALRQPGERAMKNRTVGALVLLYLVVTGLTLSVFLLWLAAAVLTVRVLRSRYRAHALEVGEGQFPELHGALRRCAQRLGVPAPDLYLAADTGNWPIYTVPLPRPAIVMSSWWARHLTTRELEFFLYHELAHGALGHRALLDPINVLENVGAVSWILATPLEVARYALRPWARLADFSADRVALACMGGDLDAAASALAKVTAGDELCLEVDGGAFLAQARRVELGWALYLHEITSGRLGNARRLHQLAAFRASPVFAAQVEVAAAAPKVSWLQRVPLLGRLVPQGS